MIGGKSACARVSLLPTPLVFRLEDPKPSVIEGFEIVQMSHGLDFSILEEGQRSSIECLFSEAILSLPVPDIFDLFLEEEPLKVMEISMAALERAKSIEVAKTPNALTIEAQPTMTTGSSRTVPARVELHSSILEDYSLACEAFSNILYLADATMLLIEPLKMRRRKAVDYFLQIARDRTSKGVGEVSARAKTAEKRAQDTKMVLMKSAKENSHLLGVNEALTLEMEVLKADLSKLRAIEKVQASEQFEDEKDRFAIDAYDEGRHSIRSEVASRYPRLNLDFLDEDLEAADIDVAGAQFDPKDVS
ncbi:hypothetical protein COCNU_08G000030 [Cocos nucifera]|uniref:Uncharacterized protein n=1 Tax=Cocos nucifera TaxID=13894 RepID=A0A8K0N660_COCNU|nr:hypothetical protein COCNU_08G000030 [Cocos nucifera]